MTRVGASECGQRASFKFNIRAFHDAVLELGSVPLPVVTARIDRFIAEGDVEACCQSGGGELDFFFGKSRITASCVRAGIRSTS